jgi:hypothetical protein
MDHRGNWKRSGKRSARSLRCGPSPRSQDWYVHQPMACLNLPILTITRKQPKMSCVGSAAGNPSGTTTEKTKHQSRQSQQNARRRYHLAEERHHEAPNSQVYFYALLLKPELAAHRLVYCFLRIYNLRIGAIANGLVLVDHTLRLHHKLLQKCANLWLVSTLSQALPIEFLPLAYTTDRHQAQSTTSGRQSTLHT